MNTFRAFESSSDAAAARMPPSSAGSGADCPGRGRADPEVAVPSSGDVQEDPAGEGELAGLDDAGEQSVTARPQVAQPGDDDVLFGAGGLPGTLWAGRRAFPH